MSNLKEIRWKQRFANFEKAFQLLDSTVAIDQLSDAERAGLIQFFEVTFELSWKTLKDYLEASGFVVKSPREVIKTSIQSEILKEGQVWMDALDDRNLTTRIYDENSIDLITQRIIKLYHPAISDLYQFLKLKNDK